MWIEFKCQLYFVVEAKRAGEGFCYKKYNTKTGECKSKLKQKQQKKDCCSGGGGAGWSARKKDRTRCEPCKTSVVGIYHNFIALIYNTSQVTLMNSNHATTFKGEASIRAIV